MRFGVMNPEVNFMNQFFASILVLEEGQLILLAFVLMLVGAGLCAALVTVNSVFRRVIYFAYVAGVTTALTVSQFGWVLVPQAAEAGFLWAVVSLTLGAFVAYGAVSYYGAAARSRHVSGDTSKAWLGFVPFANLWLLFAPGQKTTEDIAPRSAAARFIADPAIVIGSLFLLAITQTIDLMSEDTPYYDVADSPELMSMISESMRLDEFFQREATLTRPELPIEVDAITRWTGIEANGETLSFVYTLTEEIGGMRPDFKDTIASQFCAEDVYGGEIARGGIIRVIYNQPSGARVATYDVSSADCR